MMNLQKLKNFARNKSIGIMEYQKQAGSMVYEIKSLKSEFLLVILGLYKESGQIRSWNSESAHKIVLDKKISSKTINGNG